MEEKTRIDSQDKPYGIPLAKSISPSMNDSSFSELSARTYMLIYRVKRMKLG